MIETVGLARLKPVRQASFTAFGALVLRDLVVLRKGVGVFIIRTIMQPLLFVFVFTYVFPKIGQGIGGASGAAQFSSLLVPGVVAIACIFQGIQAVALPLVQEFSYTREIEDRVMAPLPVWAVATEKIVAGALQGVIAGVIVFPLALVIPTTTVHLSVRWFELVTFLPLAAIVGASLGLSIGTRVKPQQVPLLFSIIVLPLTFLGATYYPWARLTPILWLKWVVLINPLVYMSEAFRTALTPQIPHMPTGLIYLALIGFAAGLTWLGIDGFNRRVLA
ncbi:MAG: type transport system permease protein [Actinomycetota bacterium]|jgi:ABC-2 type transport system permease protein|nr:type transport system permease protein [Actinomycetota bacterium]